MKYPIGILILIIGIYAITDLAIKTRYTRKRLKPKKAVFIKFFTKLNFLDKKRIKKVIGINNAKKTCGIYDIFIKKISSIPNLNKSSDRFGAVITYGNNINDAKKNCQKAMKKIIFKTK